VNNIDETSEITDVVNEEDEFELFLSSQSSVSTIHSDTDSITKIKTLLNNYKNVKREPYVSKIMSYWETEKLNHPELYKLACIVHAVPATQVHNVFLKIIN